MWVIVCPVLPDIDDRLMIDPPPAAFIASTAYLVPRNTPRALTDINWSHASVSSMSVTALPLMPALFTRMSSLPYFCPVVSTTFFQSASLVTSRCINSALPLVRVMSEATLRPSSSSVSAITTLAPSLAKRRAVAAPMPEAAPLTMATFPARRMFVPPKNRLAFQAATSGPAWLPAPYHAPWVAPRRAPCPAGRGDYTHGPSRHEIRHLSGAIPSRR